jgi:hypothetical protein
MTTPSRRTPADVPNTSALPAAARNSLFGTAGDGAGEPASRNAVGETGLEGNSKVFSEFGTVVESWGKESGDRQIFALYLYSWRQFGNTRRHRRLYLRELAVVTRDGEKCERLNSLLTFGHRLPPDPKMCLEMRLSYEGRNETPAQGKKTHAIPGRNISEKRYVRTATFSGLIPILALILIIYN